MTSRNFHPNLILDTFKGTHVDEARAQEEFDALGLTVKPAEDPPEVKEAKNRIADLEFERFSKGMSESDYLIKWVEAISGAKAWDPYLAGIEKQISNTEEILAQLKERRRLLQEAKR